MSYFQKMSEYGNYSAIIPFCPLVSILTSLTEYNPV